MNPSMCHQQLAADRLFRFNSRQNEHIYPIIFTIIFTLIIIIAIPLYIICYIFVSNYADKFTASPSQTFYMRPLNAVDHFPISMAPRLHGLNCSNAFAKNDEHIKNVLWDGRITMVSDPKSEYELDMDCESIKKRWPFPMETANSQMETEFPIAYARTIYRDFLLVEQMLAVEYAPQNFYCYSIDSKATAMFKKRIHSMASCFPNVIVSPEEYNVQSNGKNVSRSHLACLRELVGIEKRKKRKNKGISTNPWKYAILLQNQDIPLRTNAEMVEILMIYNGTNEVGTSKITKGSIQEDLNWTFHSLKLYKNGSNPWPNNERMHHTKSLNLVALSRQAVDFMLNQLQLDTFIDRLEGSRYGMDEVFISSLNSNLPDFPGGYSWRCLEEKGCEQELVSRFVIWKTWKPERCSSGYFRHDVCIMGLEDIWQLGHLQSYFYANKMLPEFGDFKLVRKVNSSKDYAAIHCWLQNLAQSRKNEQIKQFKSEGKDEMINKGRINLTVIANLQQVRYNRLRAIGRLDKFYC